MSDSFTALTGRPVVSQASAEELGSVAHVLVDAGRQTISSLTVGKGRGARVVEWDQIAGVGPDAVMVSDEGALREPRDEREKAAVKGDLELVGRRTLSDGGSELGEITDVRFDPGSGAIETVILGAREEAATSLLGAGSYAAIIGSQADREPVTPIGGDPS
jgi:uncharacterized protein YrrD